MPRSPTIADTLTKVLDSSTRPIYVVDATRRIVYCNDALATWIDLPAKRIVGRRVEFHSEQATSEEAERSDTAPLTDLCPPPHVLTGVADTGTISCQARDGRVVHRAADFIPLGRDPKPASDATAKPRAGAAPQFGVIVLLASENLSPQELSAEVAGEPSVDELHRTIRRFRHKQAKHYLIASLLGKSPAMQKVRAQVEAAAASAANVVITGRRGSGRSHVALAIHYRTTKGDDTPLVRLDCEQSTEDLFTRALDRLRPVRSGTATRATFLLENLECLPAEHQALLKSALEEGRVSASILATFDPSAVVGEDEPEFESPSQAEPTASDHEPQPVKNPTAKVDSGLVLALSTLTIRMPRLADRLEDLPLLAQYFLEATNRANPKQVGSLRSDALDALALYSWPRELDELYNIIGAAHTAAASHEITTSDLPSTIFHAVSAAGRVRREPERIVLDELLAALEKEAITRALGQTGGNKSEAAALLGMTRPRLYRRLVQLGLAKETDAADTGEVPEFIEQNPE